MKQLKKTALSRPHYSTIARLQIYCEFGAFSSLVEIVVDKKERVSTAAETQFSGLSTQRSKHKLQRELYNSVPVLVLNLAEICDRIGGKMVALRGITNVITGAARSIRNIIDAHVTVSVQVGVEVRPASSGNDWIGLVEHVKETRPELQARGFSNRKVLEYGEVRIGAIG